MHLCLSHSVHALLRTCCEVQLLYCRSGSRTIGYNVSARFDWLSAEQLAGSTSEASNTSIRTHNKTNKKQCLSESTNQRDLSVC